ncbi:MAG: histidine kinase dimerization/phospho-acceptor domain-containing protein [Oscillospiraceae bacterium]
MLIFFKCSFGHYLVLLLLATLFTLAVRIKAGGWWKNTIIYRLLRLLSKPMRWLGRSLVAVVKGIPLIWKVVLLYIGVTGINLILSIAIAMEMNYGAYVLPWVILFILFNMAVLLGLCLLALGMHKLKDAGDSLAAGEFHHQVDPRWLHGEFKQHAVNLSSIGEGMSAAVEERLRSERLKTELITNVSHDIKTPLTSIINYVDLLEKQGLEGEAAEYLAVLSRQANRLRKLTEDLVEASKASTGNLSVELVASNLSELVRQAAGEYAERLEAANLEMVLTLPEDSPYALADGRHLWRIMDNLLGNVCKYAQPGTRVYIEVFRQDGWAAVVVKNISKGRLGIDAEELMERFVRGDSSRSGVVEGSGLGLSIARSLAELQGGHFRLEVDGDLFKAIVWLIETEQPAPVAECAQEPSELTDFPSPGYEENPGELEKQL